MEVLSRLKVKSVVFYKRNNQMYRGVFVGRIKDKLVVRANDKLIRINESDLISIDGFVVLK